MLLITISFTDLDICNVITRNFDSNVPHNRRTTNVFVILLHLKKKINKGLLLDRQFA